VVVVGGGLVVVVGGVGGAVQGQGKMNSRDRMKDSSTSRGTGGMVHRRAAARCRTQMSGNLASMYFAGVPGGR